ncbi:MAG TPA: YeiH family protein [Rhizomicrobium sp.]
MSDPADLRSPSAAGAAAEAVIAALPGLTLTGAIALGAFALRQIPGVSMFSPMILATILGMLFHNLVGTPAACRPGVIFSLKRILRLGIILLGFQLALSQVIAVGGVGVAIILITLVATFVFTKTMGRVLGVDPKLAELIGAGTSICGASAVIATNTVTRGKDSDVAYAVACVTVFGSLAMLLYPLLPGLLHLNPRDFGLWSGASIHEIAQVVAASFQDGQVAGQFGTVAKLTRVMMLAPLVIGLGMIAARTASAGTGPRQAPPMPWFVLGFIAVMLLNSAISVAPAEKAQIVSLTNFLLSMALAAMGLETDFAKLKREGLKPLGLAACAWAFVALFSLALVKLFA